MSISLFIIILLIIIASIICYSLWYYLWSVNGGDSNSLQQCSLDIVRLVGGAEKIVSLRVLNKITPYLKEVGDSKPIEEYLLKHFEYRAHQRDELRNAATRDELAPKKYKMLHTIIADIINNNNIYTAEEFIKRARLTYREFLPDEYRKIFDEYVRRAQPVKEDVKKVSKIFDKYLSDEGTYLIKSKLLDKTNDLIRTNGEYKFKHGRLDLTPAKLRAMAVSDPKKVFELDYVGMLPAMHEQAEASATLSLREKSQKSVEEELRRQFERDIETLRLLRDYPSTLARQRERDEIARRLELAAARLYSPSYARKLLKDLYYDYPYLTTLGTPRDTWYDYAKRRDAERETADERARRIEAERQRDAARAAQVAADRAVATFSAEQEKSRIDREEKERERQGEAYMQEAREREAALQAQIARAYEQSPAAERAQLLKQRAEEAQEAAELAAVGIDPTKPPEGVDPELWATMGAKERRALIESRKYEPADNIYVPPFDLD